MTQGKRLLIIYNPTAGRRHEGRFWKILKKLEAKGCQLTLSQTEGPGHATEIACAAIKNMEISAVIAAGGDGTLGEVAQGLSGSEMPLGIIPLGTANVFACEIGVGTNTHKIVSAIAHGHKTRIWPGLIEGRRFLLMVGCGYDSIAVAGLNPIQKRKWGALAYLLSAIRVRKQFNEMAVTVKFGGKHYKAASVVVSRTKKYGGPFTVFPRADLRNRDFQILLLQKGGVLQAMLYAVAMGINLLPRLKSVMTHTTSDNIEITSEHRLPSQRDGDLEIYTPLALSLDDKPLNFLMPGKGLGN